MSSRKVADYIDVLFWEGHDNRRMGTIVPYRPNTQEYQRKIDEECRAAYGRKYEIDKNTGQMLGDRWDEQGNVSSYPPNRLRVAPLEYQPIRIPNEGRCDFRIIEGCSTGYSNRWLIEDPRGWFFTIPSAALTDLILKAKINQGVIVDYLQYRTGQTLEIV